MLSEMITKQISIIRQNTSLYDDRELQMRIIRVLDYTIDSINYLIDNHEAKTKAM